MRQKREAPRIVVENRNDELLLRYPETTIMKKKAGVFE
jgi:hypothetical protein